MVLACRNIPGSTCILSKTQIGKSGGICPTEKDNDSPPDLLVGTSMLSFPSSFRLRPMRRVRTGSAADKLLENLLGQLISGTMTSPIGVSGRFSFPKFAAIPTDSPKL